MNDLLEYKKDCIYFVMKRVIKALDGGKGSGNFGHSGRPGKIGGSSSSGGDSSKEKSVSNKNTENNESSQNSENDEGDYNEFLNSLGVRVHEDNHGAFVDTLGLSEILKSPENLKNKNNYGVEIFSKKDASPALKAANYLIFGKPLEDTEGKMPRDSEEYAKMVQRSYTEYFNKDAIIPGYTSYGLKEVIGTKAEEFCENYWDMVKYDRGSDSHKREKMRIKRMMRFGEEMRMSGADFLPIDEMLERRNNFARLNAMLSSR